MKEKPSLLSNILKEISELMDLKAKSFANSALCAWGKAQSHFIKCLNSGDGIEVECRANSEIVAKNLALALQLRQDEMHKTALSQAVVWLDARTKIELMALHGSNDGANELLALDKFSNFDNFPDIAEDVTRLRNCFVSIVEPEAKKMQHLELDAPCKKLSEALTEVLDHKDMLLAKFADGKLPEAVHGDTAPIATKIQSIDFGDVAALIAKGTDARMVSMSSKADFISRCLVLAKHIASFQLTCTALASPKTMPAKDATTAFGNMSKTKRNLDTWVQANADKLEDVGNEQAPLVVKCDAAGLTKELDEFVKHAIEVVECHMMEMLRAVREELKKNVVGEAVWNNARLLVDPELQKSVMCNPMKDKIVPALRDCATIVKQLQELKTVVACGDASFAAKAPLAAARAEIKAAKTLVGIEFAVRKILDLPKTPEGERKDVVDNIETKMSLKSVVLPKFIGDLLVAVRNSPASVV